MTTALLSDSSLVSGQPDAVARAVAIDRGIVRREHEWVADLRTRGVKAAHPDDGWVDRKRNRIHLCYPQFNDGLNIGDLLALGGPERERLVRITGRAENKFAVDHEGPWYWLFEPTPV